MRQKHPAKRNITHKNYQIQFDSAFFMKFQNIHESNLKMLLMMDFVGYIYTSLFIVFSL